MKRPTKSETAGFLTGLIILATLATMTNIGGCTGPSQTTTGHIEWNIQPSTTPQPNGTTLRAPTTPQPPR